jgi:hypothetical protein
MFEIGKIISRIVSLEIGIDQHFLTNNNYRDD